MSDSQQEKITGFDYLELVLRYVENDKEKLIEKFKKSVPIIQDTVNSYSKEIKSSDKLSLANSIAKNLAFFIGDIEDNNQFSIKFIEGFKTKKFFKLLEGFSNDAQIEINEKLLDLIKKKKNLNTISNEIAVRLSEIVKVYNNIKDKTNSLKGSDRLEMLLRSLGSIRRFLDVRFYMSEYLIRYTLKTALEDGQVKRVANNYGKGLEDFVANRLANVLEEYNYKKIQEFINKKSYLNFTYNHLNFMESYIKIRFNEDLKNDPKNFFKHLPIKGREHKVNGSYGLEITLRDFESYREDLDRIFCQSGEIIRDKLKIAFEEGREKGLKNNFQDNCLADFVAGKISQWITETMLNKAQEKNKNNVDKNLFYAPSLVDQLTYEYRKIKSEWGFINRFLYIIGQENLKSENARKYLHHGLGRRLGNMVRCIDNIYRIWPLNITSLKKEDIMDVEINLESFIINCDAIFNNITHIWIEEKKPSKKLKLQEIGLNKSCKKMRELFSDEFQKKLKFFDLWFETITNTRNSLAHRIPPYIPPYSIDSKDKQQVTRLYKEKDRLLLSGDIKSYNKISAEIRLYKRFIPFMAQSDIKTQKDSYLYFHQKIISDWRNIVVILEDFFEELIGEHHPFHLIRYDGKRQ